MATIATAVVVGSVLVMADKHEAAPAGHELAGAYYAVTKPPAFNFNSELPCFPLAVNIFYNLSGGSSSSIATFSAAPPPHTPASSMPVVLQGSCSA